jgi:hypothetical protein
MYSTQLGRCQAILDNGKTWAWVYCCYMEPMRVACPSVLRISNRADVSDQNYFCYGHSSAYGLLDFWTPWLYSSHRHPLKFCREKHSLFSKNYSIQKLQWIVSLLLLCFAPTSVQVQIDLALEVQKWTEFMPLGE